MEQNEDGYIELEADQEDEVEDEKDEVENDLGMEMPKHRWRAGCGLDL